MPDPCSDILSLQRAATEQADRFMSHLHPDVKDETLRSAYIIAYCHGYRKGQQARDV